MNNIAELLEQLAEAITRTAAHGPLWEVTVIVATAGESRKHMRLQKIKAADQGTALALAMLSWGNELPCGEHDLIAAYVSRAAV